MTRRHLDVDDGHIGPVCERLAQEGVRVARVADDVEARFAEHTHDALAHQNVVLADDDSHGRRHAVKLYRGYLARHAGGRREAPARRTQPL